MAVEVGGIVPRAVLVVKVQHGAFADVDKETDVLPAPIVEGRLANGNRPLGRRQGDLLLEVLVAAAQLVVHATHCL